MSDMDEGDTPYAEKSCKGCGLVATPLVVWATWAEARFQDEPVQCPHCRTVQWPAGLEERYPYDGAGRPERHVLSDVTVRGIRVSYDHGWRVSSQRSVYAPTPNSLTEGQAIKLACECLLLDAEPGTLGPAQEKAKREAPMLRFARANRLGAAKYLQAVMDEGETHATRDPDVVAEELGAFVWLGTPHPERSCEDRLERALIDMIVSRYYRWKEKTP